MIVFYYYIIEIFFYLRHDFKNCFKVIYKFYLLFFNYIYKMIFQYLFKL